MIFSHSTRLPIILRVGEGLSKDIDDIVRQHNLLFTNKLLVSTVEIADLYPDVINQMQGSMFLIKNNFISEAEKLISHLSTLPPDTLLLAFGGGQVIDVVKYAATRNGSNYLSVPTALSNDGIYSPVAVLSDSHRRCRFGANIPLGIVVDLDIVTKAPLETIKSGIGDVISNQSALLDWQMGRDNTGEVINDFAYTQALMSVKTMIRLNPEELGTPDFCAQLAYSLIISGLAMEISGDSRPCSGAEHLISHAIDELYPERSTFHGIQVAAASVMLLKLHEKNVSDIEPVLKKFKMPTNLWGFGFNDTEIINIIEYAKKMRNRYTILNTMEIDNKMLDKMKSD